MLAKATAGVFHPCPPPPVPHKLCMHCAVPQLADLLGQGSGRGLRPEPIACSPACTCTGQAPPTCWSLDALPGVNESALFPAERRYQLKGWKANAAIAAGHQTMYFGIGSMIAAWDVPGGIRTGIRWQVDLAPMLAERGVSEEDTGQHGATQGFYVISKGELAMMGTGTPVPHSSARHGPRHMGQDADPGDL